MNEKGIGLLTEKQAKILESSLKSGGLTQSEMAEKLGMTQPEFSRLLQRARKNAIKAKETMEYLKEIGFFKDESLEVTDDSVMDLDETHEIDEVESVFHKKLKLKLKEKGDEGRILFLIDYLDFLIRNKKTVPPDFPTFVREIMGLDNRAGFIHIRIWHENSELVEFAINRGYEYRVDHYD